MYAQKRCRFSARVFLLGHDFLVPGWGSDYCPLFRIAGGTDTRHRSGRGADRGDDRPQLHLGGPILGVDDWTFGRSATVILGGFGSRLSDWIGRALTSRFPQSLPVTTRSLVLGVECLGERRSHGSDLVPAMPSRRNCLGMANELVLHHLLEYGTFFVVQLALVLVLWQTGRTEVQAG